MDSIPPSPQSLRAFIQNTHGPQRGTGLEASARRTPLHLEGDVMPALERAWPSSTLSMRIILASQIGLETGGGASCFNFNVGNVKARAGEGFMYLHGVREVVSRQQATAELAHAEPGRARLEKVLEGGRCVLVFEPPHPQTRFRAFPSLDAGIARSVAYFRRVAADDQRFADALAAGDVGVVVHTLKSRGYFTGSERAYRDGMEHFQQRLIRERPAARVEVSAPPLKL